MVAVNKSKEGKMLQMNCKEDLVKFQSHFDEMMSASSALRKAQSLIIKALEEKSDTGRFWNQEEIELIKKALEEMESKGIEFERKSSRFIEIFG